MKLSRFRTICSLTLNNKYFPRQPVETGQFKRVGIKFKGLSISSYNSSSSPEHQTTSPASQPGSISHHLIAIALLRRQQEFYTGSWRHSAKFRNSYRRFSWESIKSLQFPQLSLRNNDKYYHRRFRSCCSKLLLNPIFTCVATYSVMLILPALETSSDRWWFVSLPAQRW